MQSFIKTEGYSLIEIILVILIIGIAIPPVIHLFTYNLTSSVNSEIYTKACQFAEEKMEEILADKRADDAGRGYDYIVYPNRYSSDNPETGYSRSVSISQTTTAGVQHAEIVVTVSHDLIENVVLTTWVSDYE